MNICRQCGATNRPGAHTCLTCGADLRTGRPAGTPAPSPAPPAAPSGPPKGGTLRPLVTARRRVLAGRFAVLKGYQLPNSAYYDVRDLLCSVCNQHNDASAERCTQCGSDLAPRLLHETTGPEPAMPSASFARLSHTCAGILPHYAVVHAASGSPQGEEHTYAALEPPTTWQPLSHLMSTVDAARATQWIGELSAAMHDLHNAGATWGVDGFEYLENVLILNGGESIALADISRGRMLPAGAKGQAHITRDVQFLGRALLHMLTRSRPTDDGGPTALREPAQWPPATPANLRRAISAALRGTLAGVDDFMAAVQQSDAAPAPPGPGPRRLTPVAALATDTGRRRSNNEDRAAVEQFERQVGNLTVPVGLYLVADGVGGQSAGEVASQTVRDTVTDWIRNALADPRARTGILYDSPGALLAHAIEVANRAVYQARTQQQTNMSTTVTAALVLAGQAYIANVGDSRTYLLRQGELRQITRDHSLASKLAEAGAITPEQARTYPQRSVLVRAMGEQDSVEVDLFTEALQAGDVLLLCSDGLWEMVPDEVLRATLRSAPNPQAVADALVAAANEAGGNDNITVVVVGFRQAEAR
jgi:serine/threonine protein phosphatase PrpC/ribosomal protein L40E